MVDPVPSGGSAPQDANRIAARAAELRKQHLEEIRTSRLDDQSRKDQLSRSRDAAKAGAADAEKDAAGFLKSAKETMAEAKYFEAEAKKREFKDPKEAQEYRELAAETRAKAEQLTGLAGRAQADGERYRAEAERLTKEYEEAEQVSVDHMVALENAERQIDRLEDKARLLGEAETRLQRAEEYERESARARADGNTKGAEALAAEAARNRTAAAKAQKEAEAIVVHEDVLKEAGLDAPEPAAPQASAEPVVPPDQMGDVVAADALDEVPDLGETSPVEEPALAAEEPDLEVAALSDPAPALDDVEPEHTFAEPQLPPEPAWEAPPEPEPELTFDDPPEPGLPTEPAWEPPPEPEPVVAEAEPTDPTEFG